MGEAQYNPNGGEAGNAGNYMAGDGGSGRKLHTLDASSEKSNLPWREHKVVSQSTRVELVDHLKQAQDGKHFDGNETARVGEYLYPSSIFPLRNGKKAIVEGFAESMSLEYAVAMISKDTNLAMNPEKSKASTGDDEYDRKRARTLDMSATYPIVDGDIVQVAFIGFRCKWKEDEDLYVDFFRNQDFNQIPALTYSIVGLGSEKDVLTAKQFVDLTLHEKKYEHIGDLIKVAENMGDYELPDGTVMAIKDVANTFPIVKVHVQLQMHIKYSDKENRKPAENFYQSGIKLEEVKAKPDEDLSLIDVTDDVAGTFAGLSAQADAMDGGVGPNDDTAIVPPPGLIKMPAGGENVDPHAETSYMPPEQMKQVKKELGKPNGDTSEVPAQEMQNIREMLGIVGDADMPTPDSVTAQVSHPAGTDWTQDIQSVEEAEKELGQEPAQGEASVTEEWGFLKNVPEIDMNEEIREAREAEMQQGGNGAQKKTSHRKTPRRSTRTRFAFEE